MAVLTLYVAASRCPHTGAAGWAAIACQGARVLAARSAPMRASPADRAVASMAAAANAVAMVIRDGLVQPGDRVQLVSDSREVAATLFTGEAAPLSPRTGPMVRKARQLARDAGLSASVLLRRHPSDGPGLQAASMARDAATQAARSLNGPVQAWRPAILASSPCAPLDRFSSVPSRNAVPYQLVFAHVLRVPPPRGGALGMACAAWHSGACDARQVERIVEAAMAAQRAASPQTWALTCERLGFVRPGAWEEDAARAESAAARITAAEAAHDLLARHPSPQALADLDVGSYARQGASAVTAALLRRLGYDGVEWIQADGTRCHAILEASQAEPCAAPEAHPDLLTGPQR